MRRPPLRPLLPGVLPCPATRPVVCATARTIRAARRRALAREAVELALLVTADLLLIRWNQARLPLATRETTLMLVFGVNLAWITAIWATRTLPRWRARRIAATWSWAERSRLERVLKIRAGK